MIYIAIKKFGSPSFIDFPLDAKPIIASHVTCPMINYDKRNSLRIYIGINLRRIGTKETHIAKLIIDILHIHYITYIKINLCSH